MTVPGRWSHFTGKLEQISLLLPDFLLTIVEGEWSQETAQFSAMPAVCC
jgi:hypothetical protein